MPKQLPMESFKQSKIESRENKQIFSAFYLIWRVWDRPKLAKKKKSQINLTFYVFKIVS